MSSVKEKVKLVWFGLGATRAVRVRRLIVEIIASISTGALVLFASHYGSSGFRHLGRGLSEPVVVSIVGSMTVSAGFLAHWFKRKNQRVYGRVEMVFGMVTAYAIASALTPERAILPQCASLVGCAYVIARGLNNISEANARALKELVERLKGIQEAVGKLSELTALLKSRDQIPNDPA